MFHVEQSKRPEADDLDFIGFRPLFVFLRLERFSAGKKLFRPARRSARRGRSRALRLLVTLPSHPFESPLRAAPGAVFGRLVQLRRDEIQPLLRVLVAAEFRQLEPEAGLLEIDGEPFAVGVHHAEIDLRPAVARQRRANQVFASRKFCAVPSPVLFSQATLYHAATSPSSAAFLKYSKASA